LKPSDKKGNGNASHRERGDLRGVPPLSGNGGKKGSDPRKIQALRNAVDSGNYRVESRKVAEKIVKDAVREIRSRLR